MYTKFEHSCGLTRVVNGLQRTQVVSCALHYDIYTPLCRYTYICAYVYAIVVLGVPTVCYIDG